MNINEFEKYIDHIMERDPGVFMNMSYGLLTNFPDDILNDNNIPNKQKREGIKKIIDYFERAEEYEKCAKLNDVLKSIKD